MDAKLRVDLLDDDRDRAIALARLLAVEGHRVRTFKAADEFFRCSNESEPACVILDAAIAGDQGLEILDSIAAAGLPFPVIFLVRRGDVTSCAQAMRRGAIDCLARPAAVSDLRDALQRAEALGLAWQQARSHRTVAQERLSRLTPREREVLALVLSGHRNKRIAAELSTAESTVKVHRSRLMRKLGTRSLAELIGLLQHLDARVAGGPAPETGRALGGLARALPAAAGEVFPPGA